MAIKYNKTMVSDYIIGNDILEYELKELENDARFMSEVIIQSKDTKMYDFASDDVKRNYYFVRTVIETFKDNEKFIINVANHYLKYAKEYKKRFLFGEAENVINMFDYAEGNNEMLGINFLEINVLMENLINDKELKENYVENAGSEYVLTKLELEIYNQERKNNPDLANIGLGFLYVMEKYNSNPIILDFYAKRMLNDLFYDEDELFSDKLHRTVKSKEEFTKDGIKNFIVNYVKRYDEFLSGHIQAMLAKDSKFILELEKDILRVIKNWDLYVENEERSKMDEIWFRAYDEYEKYNTEYSFAQYVDAVMKKFGLEELNEKYSYVPDWMDEIEEFPEELTNISDIAFMNYLEKFISNLFGLTDGSDEVGGKSKGTAKIITFPKK